MRAIEPWISVEAGEFPSLSRACCPTRGTLSRRGYSPPWIRRGGRDLKKISRSNLLGSGRGGSFKLPIIGGLNEPPRLRELMWLRESFLIAQPPLLIQGGEFALLAIVPALSNSPIRSGDA